MAEVPLPTPTQAPVPSTDIRNAVFAGAKLDEEVTGTGEFYTDRLGVKRLTNTGRNNQFDAAQLDRANRFEQFLLSSGYVFLGDYEDGPFQFSARNQYIRYNNQYYRLNAATDVGFTTTGTDATSFANDVSHFVLMDGDALRQNLGSSEGLKLVGQCASIAALRAITLESVGQQVFVKEHTSGMGQGGGIFYCHSLTNPGSLVDDNGFQIVTASGQVLRRKDRSILSAEMFGYIPDFNTTTQVGTDNATALRNAIKAAISFKYTKVVLPAGAALVDVTSGDINLGGQGYSGTNGVRVQGQGQQSTRLFVRGPLNSVCFSNIGGSGSSSYKSISGLTLICTTDSTRNVILYRMQGCCMSHNHDLYLLNGLIGVQYYNAPNTGTFTEFNTLSYSRVQGCLYNISFEVNGGDNSFHGNSFVNVQNQILAGSTYGVGVRVLGSTAPAYLYNQTWDMKFFGGTNCRAFLLTNCNTDNLYGNLTFEGNIICETTDESYFEFKGNLAGISGTTFSVAAPTTRRAANFVFNNTLSDSSAFTNATLSSYSPRIYNPELADATDNGVAASLWRVRSSIGDGVLFNAFSGSPGWFFTTTAFGQRIQSASPKYSFGSDGNNITAYSATVFLNPNNSTYGVQLSAENARFSPRQDNVMSCGSGGYRWTQVFAANSTISTCDKRKKTNLRQIYDAEVDAFYEIGLLDSVWQWIDKYQAEGDDARLHAGPTVQDAIEIMDKYGLDWTKYSCFCHTIQDAIPAVVESWDDEYQTIPARAAIYENDGVTIRQEAEDERVELVREAGSRIIKEAEPAVDEYAFRKEELLFWITRATIAKQQEILNRLDALEQ
ncbi:tail fiber domain-containing protein [Klebsiella quasipneumoniae]|uniref:tail fiber domain-containing protein n=1 Tax=Klebsiella quasipneumoniae TaxID=1463165 RepID=UPI00197B6A00|nr:tail fiber domain-containing protein [Klebsiella quasipneumoniae]